MPNRIIKYNLCYVRQGDHILLLNREKPGWLGCWNGVGGKLDPNEDPRKSVEREVFEETNLYGLDFQFKGLKTWSTVEGTDFGGLYLYITELPVDFVYNTPLLTDEGILHWKHLDWILDPQNLGVAYSLPNSLRFALSNSNCFDHHSVYNGNNLVEETHTAIDPVIETNPVELHNYLKKYNN